MSLIRIPKAQRETLYTPAEAAAQLAMSIKTLMAHVRGGRLRFINISTTGKRKRYRFTQKNLDTFIENQKVREAPKCLSIKAKKAPSTLTTSNLAAIGFTALQKQKANEKPKL